MIPPKQVYSFSQKKSTMWKEFKAFAISGNLMDIAIGFVMGGAFAKVSGAFTGGIIAPIIGLLTSGVDLSKYQSVIRPEVKGPDGAITQEALIIQWGGFITSVIDFLIVAFVMFLTIRAINKLRLAKEEVPAPPAEVTLLEEIRDLLKQK
jgi:large conductance mechanosensitive channel